MKTCDIIKEILSANSLSQDKLANILNVSQKAISNWVNGADVPKASSMLLIYENFGISPNELLGIEEPKSFYQLATNNNYQKNEYEFTYIHADTKLIHKERK